MSQWLKRRIGLTAALACAFASAAFAQSGDVLKTAKEVGKEMSEWKYGTDESKKQIDETHFLLKVIERLEPKLKSDVKTRILMSDLKDEQTSHDEGGIISKGDKRTKGAVQAIVDAGLGHEVKLADAKAGDILVYWINTKAYEENNKEEKDKGDKSKDAKAGEKDHTKSGDKEKDHAKAGDKTGKADDKGKDKAAGDDKAAENWECRCGVIEKVEMNKKNEPKAWIYGAFKFTHGIGTMPKNGVRLVEAEDRKCYVVRFGKSAKP